MTAVCKTWSIPARNFNSLCSNLYEAVNNTNECPVCVRPVSSQISRPRVCSFDPLACLKQNPLSSSEPPVFVPSNLSIEFQSGDMMFQRTYVCNRTVNPGTYSKTLIPELVGKVVSFPVVYAEPYSRIWQTEWISCGPRFSSYKKINFATGATTWYYRQDWDVDFRLTMQIGNGQLNQCYLYLATEVRKKNIVTSGTPWWGLGGPQGPAWEPCYGSQIAYYLWNFSDGQIQNIPWNVLDSNCSYTEGDPTYLAQLSNDLNKAEPVFNWRFGIVGCVDSPHVANSIDEEVVCEESGIFSNCRSYSVKTYPRFTSGIWDYEGCGVVTVTPAWQPGIITVRMFEG
jgi:hypothetical protein